MNRKTHTLKMKKLVYNPLCSVNAVWLQTVHVACHNIILGHSWTKEVQVFNYINSLTPDGIMGCDHGLVRELF
uniref:Uncharacterized protein n=1 Tax=Arion vulgaris TaxID=1028688 RepID=A0A0B6ZAQ9_9EUPU